MLHLHHEFPPYPQYQRISHSPQFRGAVPVAVGLCVANSGSLVHEYNGRGQSSPPTQSVYDYALESTQDNEYTE